MKVSIIIPLYNCEKWIDATLESCLAQRPYVKEIIIADNGSTDTSKAIAMKWESFYPEFIKVMDASAIKGANHARNIGFKNCTGEYVQWLDGDDRLLPEKLKAQLDTFEQYEDADIVYSDWQLDTYDENGEKIKSEYMIVGERGDFLRDLLRDRWLSSHTYLLKYPIASKLYQKGYWNEETTVGQDREYYTQAALLGAKFVYCPGNMVVYNRWSRQSISQKVKFNERKASILKQLLSYKDEIRKNEQIPYRKKRCYEKIINTQLVECAMWLNATIKLPHWKDINWNNIYGIRTRVKSFVFWLKSRWR